MKKLYLIVLGLLLAGNYVLAADKYPQFSEDGQFILADSQGGLCGGFKLRPLPGFQNINLEAYRTDIGFWSKVENIDRVGSDTLPAAGKRYKYDWGGLGTTYGYKIYCFGEIKTGKREQVKCKDVVAIEDVRHNVPCVGVAGPSAEYGELNMYRDAPVTK